ncbi:hypothetical protein H2198_004788 [Neophaeococcomyces mojaviensis]|uniref:Uncharacterized protein n=1 Tax=Neophaeococcomyces mojaviensis TaxID=3383035 RepID=A0ACC3A817_9EURO|nr:hypothetical protein H2198_004788 [Knufia sp. JES_112]
MSSPITCHVLNTVSGTPADNLKATLTLLSRSTTGLQAGLSFNAVTNDDGRVKEWAAAEDGTTLNAVMDKYGQGDKIACSIKFEIGAWYEERGTESFWPEVEIKFYVKKGERHYHVPCLVGPWTYTTYRGS